MEDLSPHGGPSTTTVGRVSDGIEITVGQVESAAQPVRFGLLGLSDLGWFLASAAAERLRVERGTIRLHADALVAQCLAERREREGAPKQTFEWRITPLGAALHRRISELIGETLQPPSPVPARPATLLAVDRELESDDLATALAGLSRKTRATPIPGYWVAQDVGSGSVA